MTAWLQALSKLDCPAVLVTVALAEGSVPREAGASMVVFMEREVDTIGGGHLEFKAIAHAREMLKYNREQPQTVSPAMHLQRVPLGPTLGQCCGGAVTLAFELLMPQHAPQFQRLSERLAAAQASWRLTALNANTTDCASHALPAPRYSQSCSTTPSVPDDNVNLLCDSAGRVLNSDGEPAEDRQQEFPALAHEKHCHLFDDRAKRRWLASPFRPFPTQLFLFGAGHVGAALVSVLGQLPCRITWVDERVSLCPSTLPANTVFEATDTPEAVASQAPPGASFLVMTHSHPLDQVLAEQILRRGDFGWFGLIGSRTKRIQFERRLLARGIPPAVLARMQCPVGLPGIDGKQPAVIAIAVAAQLLQVWQNQGKLSHSIADRIAS